MTVAELIDALRDADPASEVEVGGAAVVAALVPCRPREMVAPPNNPREALGGHAIFPAEGRPVRLVVSGPAICSVAAGRKPRPAPASQSPPAEGTR